MLSKIERGEASPTAALLGRLSAALGLTLSQLFARMEDAIQLARAEKQPLWRDPETGFVRRSLTPSGGSRMELVWGELPPGAKIPYPRASYAFIVDQQLVVIDGTLTIREGSRIFELGAGDCLRFDLPQDVMFDNTGSTACHYIISLLRSTQVFW
jgi:transcriptional regulator with XRE-family HTH domain